MFLDCYLGKGDMEVYGRPAMPNPANFKPFGLLSSE